MATNPGPFESVKNQPESIVFELVAGLAESNAAIQANPALLADIACIALNSLKPRYICRPEFDAAPIRLGAAPVWCSASLARGPGGAVRRDLTRASTLIDACA